MAQISSGRRRLIRGGIAFLGLAAVSAAAGGTVMTRPDFGGKPEGERLRRMMSSPHWAEGQFQNLDPMAAPPANRSQFEIMSEFLFDRNPARFPVGILPHTKTNLPQLPQNQFVWLGHSGFFLRMEGVSVIIDPALHQAFPLPGFYKPFPGADAYHPQDLPAADLLVITHDHYDHLDYETVRELRSRVKRAVCPLGVGAHLEVWGWEPDRITELDWFEATKAGPLTITALPSQHFSGRTFRRNETLWAGYMFSANGVNVYHSGDTSWGRHFAQIREMFPRIDIALLEDGQYNEDWPGVHLLPQAWGEALEVIRPEAVLAMHNSKFCLSRHSWQEPLERAFATTKAEGFSLLTPEIGEAVALDPALRKSTREWWKTA